MNLDLELQADLWQEQQELLASLATDPDFQRHIAHLDRVAVLQQEHPDWDDLPTKEDDLLFSDNWF